MPIMFVCKHNSRRSHMAEGFARQLAPQSWRIESSGLEASKVDPLTVAVMYEVGVDISQQVSQALSDFQADEFTVVISLCGCGVDLPEPWKARRVFQDWQLEDPAGATIETFRVIRDQVKSRVETLIQELQSN